MKIMSEGTSRLLRVALALALIVLMLPHRGIEASAGTALGAPPPRLLLTGDRLGIMTGGIYQTGIQPLSQFAGPVLYDIGNRIGAKWIRLEMGWSNQNNADVIAKTTEMAHKLGMRVIVLYTSPDRSGVDDNNGTAVQNNIINPYINYLNQNIPTAFRTNASIPDAFETGNEYNTCIVEPCSNFGFRVGGNATAWLARRVKEHFQRADFMNGRWAGVKVLSAGTINTAVVQEPVWWNAFLSSNAWCRSGNCANNDRYMPFDNVAVHPYNPYGLDLECINYGSLWCWDSWYSYTQQSMANLRDRVSSSNGGTYKPLFVTEYHWKYMPEGPNHKCDNRANCVKTEDQMRHVMDLSLQAFGESWQTEVAIWADYRSGDGGNSGVRQSTFDYANNRFPAQDSIWYKLKSQAGGSGFPNDMWPGSWVRRFTDMAQSDQYYIEAQILNRDFIVHGRPNGRYDTWSNVTRREFSVFLTRALARYKSSSWTIDNPTWSPFVDVPVTDPDFQYIITLYNRNVISGYGSEFKPENNLTRAQAAKMFKIANGWPDESPQPRCQFTDVPSDYWAYVFISTVCNHGLFSGYADGTFRPGNPLLRGQVAANLYRNFLGGTAPRYESEPPATAGHPVNKNSAHTAE